MFERLTSFSTPGLDAPAVGFPSALLAPAAAAPAMAGAAIQRAGEDPQPASNNSPNGSVTPAHASTQHATAEWIPGARPSDDGLTRLTEWLYPLLSYKIRGELRDGRERSGLVTDQYRRW